MDIDERIMFYLGNPLRRNGSNDECVPRGHFPGILYFASSFHKRAVSRRTDASFYGLQIVACDKSNKLHPASHQKMIALGEGFPCRLPDQVQQEMGGTICTKIVSKLFQTS
jgi:hypothetical protein